MPPAAIMKNGGPVSVQPPRRRRILVVDDEAEVTIFLADLLSIEGFAVETARDGADALSRLEQGAFDALLVDLRIRSAGSSCSTASSASSPPCASASCS
jgi:DNA-binding response OmpR family regulator